MGALASLAHEDRLLIVWGLRTENHAARRFYERLGASVHEKSVASWPPHEYAARLAPLAAPVAGA